MNLEDNCERRQSSWATSHLIQGFYFNIFLTTESDVPTEFCAFMFAYLYGVSKFNRLAETYA